MRGRQSVRIKFSRSLLSRYMLIILVAVLFVPVLVPFSFLGSWLIDRLVFPETYTKQATNPYRSSTTLAGTWHKEALDLKQAPETQIEARLKELKQRYPKASIFRVSHEGKTTLELPPQPRLPDSWTAEQLIQFMKDSQNKGPFTVVAFIGDNADTNRGFMVFQLPRELLNQPTGSRNSTRFYGILLILLILFFVGMSYWFIREIRRRLLRLSNAMESPAESGIPLPIEVERPDEIGGLEDAFNGMIVQLQLSRRREQEEETLRKALIGNLSHDLRTPLTVIGSHLYSLKEEPLTEQGQTSIRLMEAKLHDLDHLIDHLLSYSLLTSGKYKLELQNRDVLRLVRESAAAWYPLWEKEGLEPEIDLDDQTLLWTVDDKAFRRVLDNLFQNAVRHAASGRYIGLFVRERAGSKAFVIVDHGPGMTRASDRKGAGLGLAITDLLLKEMGLIRRTESGPEGTTVWISPVFLNKI